MVLGETPICEACYEEAGLCCLEFGGQDLWNQREHGPPDEPPSGRQSDPG